MCGRGVRVARSSRALVVASRQNELSNAFETDDVSAFESVSKVREGGTPSPTLETSVLPGIRGLAFAQNPRRLNLHIHIRLQPRTDEADEGRNGFVERFAIGAHDDLRLGGRFVRRADAGEFRDLPSARFFVEPFRIAPLANLHGRIDEDLDEIHAAFERDLP